MKWWWCLALVVASGCAGPLAFLTREQKVNALYSLRSDGFIEPDVARVQRSLAATTPGLARWGGLEHPVTVYVVSSHQALEDAVRRPGYDWLRAWARYDDVIIQAPSTWNASPEALDQLVLHEVTHCLLFQKAATRDDWMKKDIPLWFREGMAVVTAKQQRLYPSLEDTTAWLLAHPDDDVFKDGEALSEQHYQPVYGFSLHAFTFLENRFGAERIGDLLRAMRTTGQDFTTSFEAALGMPLTRFERDFLVFLRLRGFRSMGKRPADRIDLKELIKQRPMSPNQIDPRPEGDGPSDVPKTVAPRP